MDCSPPGSSVHRIFQARILEWWPFPSPGDITDPGIKPRSLLYSLNLHLKKIIQSIKFILQIHLQRNSCALVKEISWNEKFLEITVT